METGTTRRLSPNAALMASALVLVGLIVTAAGRMGSEAKADLVSGTSSLTALTVEANGPTGSVVTYTVTAADDGVPLLPSAVSCSPASGARFPIATTTVTCTAADSLGNSGSTSFWT